jgi:hypothetical protein
VDPYLAAAVNLQMVGQEMAVKLLKDFSNSAPLDKRAIVLCRVLFAARQGETFRRASSGIPSSLGELGTQRAEDWPLEPIELVDGVPFLIVRGYSLGGYPELASDYLDYCIKNCKWSTFKYSPKNAEEKQRALDKLVGYLRFKARLPEADENFLSAQIK